jgi:hypothetical protein
MRVTTRVREHHQSDGMIGWPVSPPSAMCGTWIKFASRLLTMSTAASNTALLTFYTLPRSHFVMPQARSLTWSEGAKSSSNRLAAVSALEGAGFEPSLPRRHASSPWWNFRVGPAV